MANQSDILSDEFESNLSFKVNTQSAFFSADTNIDLTSTSGMKVGAQSSKTISSIHKHTHPVTEADKAHMKKKYLCRYYPPEDTSGYYTSTDRLRGHLQSKYGITWTRQENEPHMIPRDAGESLVQALY